VNQVAQFLAVVAELSIYAQWIIGVAGGFCVLVMLVIMAKIGVKLYRFARSPRIEMQPLKLLQERSEWQQLAAKKHGEAREKLKTYLREFSFDENDKLEFQLLGMKPEDYAALKSAVQKLLTDDARLGHTEWVNKFQSEVQSHLDHLAAQRVSRYYWRVFGGTALSPNPMVDQIIILTSCVALVHDCLRIYRVKPAPSYSLILISRALVMVYLGGEMQEGMKNAISFVGGELAPVYGGNVLNGVPVIGNAAAPVVAAIGEGGLNALFISKLGKGVIAQLQPTVDKK
jgi:uncharacterized membrane protein YcjF (UPF0283 family)